jgi:hypothetical protein
VNRPALPERWSTPAVLRAILAAAIAASLGLLFAGQVTLAEQRSALRTIGKDAAPSVFAAQALYEALSDFDANVGNTLLGTPLQRGAASAVVEKRRIDVTDRIVDAAENITFGEAEKGPIRRLADRWSVYLDRISVVRLRRGDGDLRAAIAGYVDSSWLLHHELLEAASALDYANQSALEAAYERQRRWSAIADVFPLALGGLLFAGLIAAQVFCARRTKRLINPGLAASSLLALALVVALITAFHNGAEILRAVNFDAYGSLRTLWRARALAYDATGDDTRALLDPSLADGARRQFDENVARLTSAPRKSVAPRDLQGLLADELHNVTYAGEGEAAADMVAGFAEYYGAHSKIWEAERSGQHDLAVATCIGPATDAFARFNRALQSTVDINQVQFERLLSEGEASITSAQIMNIVFALAIALFAFVGIRPRLREYGA